MKKPRDESTHANLHFHRKKKKKKTAKKEPTGDDLRSYINKKYTEHKVYTRANPPQACEIMKHPFGIAHALIFRRMKMGENKNKKIEKKGGKSEKTLGENVLMSKKVDEKSTKI